MDKNCIFCKIVKREINANVIASNDVAFAICDINPQAPVHILLIPKIHVPNISNVQDKFNINKLFDLLIDLKGQYDLSEGFRIVANTGTLAGQTVDHLHFHLLAGRKLDWPPG